MKTDKNILGIVKGVFSADKNSSGLPRPKVEKLCLVEGYGIVDDKFANDNLNKTVMIIGKNSYDIAKKHGMELLSGSYGENILFDFDPHSFSIGDIIQVGQTKLEITERCTICNHLSVFGAKLPKLVKNYRGVYCKILEGGDIVKDEVAYDCSTACL